MHPVVTAALIVIAFAVTAYMLKKGVNIGILMLAGSVFMTFIAQIPLKKAFYSAVEGVVSEKTISTILLLFLILILENIMRTTGMISSMVDSLKELVGSRRLAAGLMPLVIGLLPSPGGARFSCPMVDEISGDTTDSGNKAFINYWFRHVWLDGFILYPGAILASTLIGISVLDFFVHMLPLMFLALLLGIVFGLYRLKGEPIVKTRTNKENIRIFIISILPVFAVIGMYIFLLRYTGHSLVIALVLVIAALFIVKKYDLKKILDTIRKAFPIKLIIIIIGVMIFKEILLDSGIMDGIPAFMQENGIPVEVLFIALPFIGGFSSGLTISYVSLAFPILIPMGLDKSIWYVVLTFTAGYVGNMVTPLHLCAAMTSDYFKAPIGKLLLKSLYASSILFIVVVAGIFLL